MDNDAWDEMRRRVASEEPLRYFLEEIAPEALAMLDAGTLDIDVVLACLRRAFDGLSYNEITPAIGTVIAARWLRNLEAGDWGAHETFRRRWDLWEYLAAERGVTFPATYCQWYFGNDVHAPVLPSERTVQRRLTTLGVNPKPT
jgi:hypothetical protein